MSFYEEIYQYGKLEAAYNCLEKRKRLDYYPENVEEWLINLHNHLVWRSYVPHDDLVADSVVLQAIESALRRKEIKPEEADAETQGIIEALTLA